jgi:hypothetical protein
MEPNPLDELYATAKERAEGRFKVITASYVLDCIDRYRAETSNKAPRNRLK